jgi:Nucleotidyltransferase domain
MIFDASDYEEKILLLKEREKELKCLYNVNGIINENLPVDEFLMEIVKHIWGGWQYPVILKVKIQYENKIYKEDDWTETEWVQSADIVIDDKVFGKIEVFYTQFRKLVGDSQFLPEEQKLLNTIATNISTYIFNKKLLKTIETFEWENDEDVRKSDDSSCLLPVQPDVHWRWRNEMVCKIAEKLDFENFGVEAMYLIGSTKNATSGPASDIDILLHFRGNRYQEKELRAWFNGWSLCLSEINYMKTGYRSDGLIDLHLVTDKDIENRNSYASMIGSVNEGARLIRKRPA